MHKLHGTYVHRGDRIRRRNTIRRWILGAGFLVAAVAVLKMREPKPATAEAALAVTQASALDIGIAGPRDLEATRGELELVRAELQRSRKVIAYSTRYGIPANLAGRILDVALAEGIDPELGFRLVKLESDFNPRATSPVGAVGLTQLMPSTARYYVKNVTAQKLYDPHLNLRVGFRYLRTLVNRYNGDVKLALLAYNRGEVAVDAAIKSGVNPTNGYDRILMKGYHGNGTVD